MNFIEMYERIKNGEKAKRSSWKDGEFLFWLSNMMVHNTPYHIADIPVGLNIQPAYKYVVEKDDPIALDWEII